MGYPIVGRFNSIVVRALLLPAFLCFLLIHDTRGPSYILADDGYVQDDGGIQRLYQDVVPQFTTDGRVQTTYTQNSFIPLVLYFPDLGDYGDAKQRLNLDNNHTRDALPLIKAAGFNLLWTHWWPPTQSELDHANTHGFKVLANLQNAVYQSVSANNWGILTNEVNRLKTHPAVFAYHLFDEDPTWPGPFSPNVHIDNAKWQIAYNTVKSADPTRLVYPNNITSDHACTYIPLGGTAPTYDFHPYSDFWSTDGYVIYPHTKNFEYLFGLHDGAITSCRGFSNVRKPYLFIGQANGEDDFVNGIRVMPTPAQMRAQMYGGLVHGATALGYFRYHVAFDNSGPPWHDTAPSGLISPEKTPAVWNEISAINSEISAHQKVLLSKTSVMNYHVWLKRGTATSQHPIHTMLKDSDDPNTKYLLAVNVDEAAIPSKFEFPRTIVSVRSVLDSRTIAPGNGESTGGFVGLSREFADAFAGYGVRLYKIDLSPIELWPAPPHSTPGLVRGNTWLLSDTSIGATPSQTITFGNSGEVPVVGDWNGDGVSGRGMVRTSGAGMSWFLEETTGSETLSQMIGFGQAGDIPVVGDWDGDGDDTIGVFRNGTWILTNDNGLTSYPVGFGQTGDIPVVGDWNGDRRSNLGVYRGGTWILTANNGQTSFSFEYGMANDGDRPVVGDWEGRGRDTIGVVRGNLWLLRNDNSSGPADISFYFGNPTGDIPITGVWR